MLVSRLADSKIQSSAVNDSAAIASVCMPFHNGECGLSHCVFLRLPLAHRLAKRTCCTRFCHGCKELLCERKLLCACVNVPAVELSQRLLRANSDIHSEFDKDDSNLDSSREAYDGVIPESSCSYKLLDDWTSEAGTRPKIIRPCALANRFLNVSVVILLTSAPFRETTPEPIERTHDG